MSITPVEALALQCVTWKVRLARKNDEQKTLITAQQVSAWILDKFDCNVSPKLCQNALRHLGSIGAVTRERCDLDGNRNSYNYGLPASSGDGFVVFLEPNNGSVIPQSGTSVPNNGTQDAALYKSTNSTKNLSKGEDGYLASTESPPVAPAAPQESLPPAIEPQLQPQPVNHPSRPFVPPAGSKQYRSTGMASNLETPLGSYTISRIEAVCRAIGDGDLPLPQNEPDRYQELRRETSS